MDEDDVLLGWLRYYVSILAACLVLGVEAAALYLGLAPTEFEAWSLVVEDGSRIPPREVGAVAEAIFRSGAVYAPAMQALGIEEDPRSFLSDSADIRPVPETNVVIIIGRAGDSQRAQEISAALADSFVQAVEARIELANFTVFDEARTVPARGEVSVPVGLSVGGAAGFWLGLGAALLHYGLRRPILGIERARRILGPTHVTSLDGSRPGWLGICRRGLGWSDSESNQRKLALVASNGAHPPVVMAPGASARALKSLARRLPDGWSLHGFHPEAADSLSQGDGSSVVVVHSGTGEEDLEETNFTGRAQPTDDRGQRSVELVWVR